MNDEKNSLTIHQSNNLTIQPSNNSTNHFKPQAKAMWQFI
jgi:hypothetical protein